MSESPAKVVAVLSGKGGAGKTTICISYAVLLSNAGYKVLLIDFDLATHGLTYFFADTVDERSAGLENLLVAKQQYEQRRLIREIIVPTRHGFDLIPSHTRFQFDEYRGSKTSNLVNATSVSKAMQLTPEQIEGPLTELMRPVLIEYDYVIVDCAAGVSSSCIAASRVASSVIVVAEADPVSTWAVKLLEYQIGTNFPRETFGLINKVTLDEQPTFQAVKDTFRMLKYLPPIPFDLEVRRAFMRLRLPADLETPSAFLSGMAESLADLLPETQLNLESVLRFEDNSLNDFRASRRERAEAQKLAILDDMQVLRNERRIDRQARVAISIMLTIMISAIFVFGIGLIFLGPSEFRFDSASPLMLLSYLSVGLFIVIVGSAVWLNRRRSLLVQELEFEANWERLSRELSRIESEIESWMVMDHERDPSDQSFTTWESSRELS